MRNQRGITLIALVITIIVLLILAGVSIAMLTGQNGILTRATTATEATREAEAEEALKLAISEILSNKLDPTYDSAEAENVINDTNIEKLVPENNSNITAEVGELVAANAGVPAYYPVTLKSGGKEYRDHLFVSEETGFAKLKLNPWESGVLKEEQGRKDFVCWIRNPSRGSWALCIPYEMDGETKPTYPDIIIVRTDKVLGYVIDILEPHNPAYKDNLGKAKGFAEYARQNPGVGRIQLIRMSEDAAKNKRFKRLDMSKSAIRDKVSHAMSNDELDHIFDTDGFFADSIED